MSKTKIFAWHQAHQAPQANQAHPATTNHKALQTVDERAPTVAVATIIPVEPAKPAAMVQAGHTQLIGSFVVSEALAKYKPEPTAIRTAAEDWAASASAGSRTVVLANVRVPSPTHSRIIVPSPATPTQLHLRAKLRERSATTTRMIANFRRMRWTRNSTKVAGLAVMLAVCGWFLGKQVPRGAQPTAAEDNVAAAEQYVKPRAEPQPTAAAAVAAADAPVQVQPQVQVQAQQTRPGEPVGQRKAIDALISGNRTLAINSYRELAARNPQQRAFAVAADILSKR